VPGGCLLALAGDLPDVLADRLQADPQRLKGLGGDALALAEQPEQDVLGADVVVVEGLDARRGRPTVGFVLILAVPLTCRQILEIGC
jgi:kynurenine formamidase